MNRCPELCAYDQTLELIGSREQPPAELKWLYRFNFDHKRSVVVSSV